MEDKRSSEDGLFVLGAKVEVLEQSIVRRQLCIIGTQLVLAAICWNNIDSTEVADVSTRVANAEILSEPWIVVGTSAAAASSKVAELMDVESVETSC